MHPLWVTGVQGVIEKPQVEPAARMTYRGKNLRCVGVTVWLGQTQDKEQDHYPEEARCEKCPGMLVD